MRGNVESRLQRLEALPGAYPPVSLLIADPAKYAWAKTDCGIGAEIERRRTAGRLSAHVVVLKPFEPPKGY
jgi:hypothetical protein